MRYYDVTKETAFEYLKRTISEHKSDECLIWPFAKNRKGYGWVVDLVTRRTVLAHRLAYRIANGEWPTPCGLHSCDTPACYNPRHIRAGTMAQNTAEIYLRNRDRHLRGSDVNTARLTEEDVKKIRAEYRPGNGVELAAKYGVQQVTISAIITGRNWKHLPNSPHYDPKWKRGEGRGYVPKGRRTGERNPAAKLTNEIVAQILQRASTSSQRALAREFGVSSTTIRRVVSRKYWCHVSVPKQTNAEAPKDASASNQLVIN